MSDEAMKWPVIIFGAFVLVGLLVLIVPWFDYLIDRYWRWTRDITEKWR